MGSTTSDHILVERIRKGDSDAWQQVIDRFEGRLLAFASARLSDRATSEDVVQETFVGFLTSLPHYDTSRDLASYLFSIAAHKLTDYLRKQGRRPWDASVDSDAQGRPLDEMPGRARAASSIVRSGERHQSEEECLVQALSDLINQWTSRGQMERLKCMELLLVRGWPNKRVAQTLGITEQAVANYKHHTVTQLKRLVQQAGFDEEAIVDL